MTPPSMARLAVLLLLPRAAAVSSGELAAVGVSSGDPVEPVSGAAMKETVKLPVRLRREVTPALVTVAVATATPAPVTVPSSPAGPSMLSAPLLVLPIRPEKTDLVRRGAALRRAPSASSSAAARSASAASADTEGGGPYAVGPKKDTPLLPAVEAAVAVSGAEKEADPPVAVEARDGAGPPRPPAAEPRAERAAAAVGGAAAAAGPALAAVRTAWAEAAPPRLGGPGRNGVAKMPPMRTGGAGEPAWYCCMVAPAEGAMGAGPGELPSIAGTRTRPRGVAITRASSIGAGGSVKRTE